MNGKITDMTPDSVISDIDHRGLGACEGYDVEIDNLNRRLNIHEPALSDKIRDQMLARIDALEDALKARNERLDKVGGPMWLGM